MEHRSKIHKVSVKSKNIREVSERSTFKISTLSEKKQKISYKVASFPLKYLDLATKAENWINTKSNCRQKL